MAFELTILRAKHVRPYTVHCTTLCAAWPQIANTILPEPENTENSFLVPEKGPAFLLAKLLQHVQHKADPLAQDIFLTTRVLHPTICSNRLAQWGQFLFFRHHLGRLSSQKPYSTTAMQTLNHHPPSKLPHIFVFSSSLPLRCLQNQRHPICRDARQVMSEGG